MKIAVIGSRDITNINIEGYLPRDTTEIVSGGARGVDAIAKEYSESHGIKFTEFLPNYRRFSRGAPYKRNKKIIEYADLILAFWDGKSRGTKYVIDSCEKLKKECRVYIID